ncbi:MAG: hypothetical protein MPJ50_02180 [Pirellulales bacterium]|nr:hypothetical protein [Pirellulales bacterium]
MPRVHLVCETVAHRHENDSDERSDDPKRHNLPMEITWGLAILGKLRSGRLRQ